MRGPQVGTGRRGARGGTEFGDVLVEGLDRSGHVDVDLVLMGRVERVTAAGGHALGTVHLYSVAVVCVLLWKVGKGRVILPWFHDRPLYRPVLAGSGWVMMGIAM